MATSIQTNITEAEHQFGTIQRRLYYDDTNDKWWFIYADGGDIFFENSTDGTTWENATQLNTDEGATCDKPTMFRWNILICFLG